MQVTHRAPADAATTAHPVELVLASFDKAPRLSCCCRLSELMPMVRQLHDTARTARLAAETAPSVAA